MGRFATIFAISVLFVVLSPTSSSSQQATESADSALALLKSREATKKLLTIMRILLSQQLAAGGAVRAIEVCADSAQVVGEKLQRELGLSIRRVSTKWRNPKNTPDEYESVRLRKFAELKSAKALTDTSEFYEVVTENSVRTFRYMRPVFIGEMCLSCHGNREKMKDLIYSSIRERYPNDKAVDFKAGDLRGAVSVRIRLGD